jgi:hypothetical protein
MELVMVCWENCRPTFACSLLIHDSVPTGFASNGLSCSYIVFNTTICSSSQCRARTICSSISDQHINIGRRFSASLDTFHSLFQLFLAEEHHPFDDPLWLVVATVQDLESTQPTTSMSHHLFLLSPTDIPIYSLAHQSTKSTATQAGSTLSSNLPSWSTAPFSGTLTALSGAQSVGSVCEIVFSSQISFS